tara:strand:+ start:3763 stop:5994 length:2232 start_codon:yes stop_codon:yes gene_type:complete
MIGCCSCSCVKHYELKRDGEDWRTLSNVSFTSGKEGVNTLNPGDEIQFNIDIPCSNYMLLVEIASADNYQNIDAAAEPPVSGFSIRAGRCNQVWHNVTYATDADIDDWQSGVSGSAWTYSAGPAFYYSQPYSGGAISFTLAELDTETGAVGCVSGEMFDPSISTPTFTGTPGYETPYNWIRDNEVNGIIEPFPAGLRTIPVTFRANSDTVVINKVSVWCGAAHAFLGPNYTDGVYPYKEQFCINEPPTTTITDNDVFTTKTNVFNNALLDDTLTISMTVDNTYLVDGTTDHDWITKYDPLLPHRRRAYNEFSQNLEYEQYIIIDETVADATPAQITHLDNIRFDMLNDLYTDDHSFEYPDPNVFFYLEPYADCTWSATYSSANNCTPINYTNNHWDSITSHAESRPVSLGPLDLSGSWPASTAQGFSCAGGWSVNTDNFQDGFASDWHNYGSADRSSRYARRFEFTRKCTIYSGGQASWMLPLTAGYFNIPYLQGYHALRFLAESIHGTTVTISKSYSPSTNAWEATTTWEAGRILNHLDTAMTNTKRSWSNSCSWTYDSFISPTDSWYDYGSPKASSVVVEEGRGIPRLKDGSITIDSAFINGEVYSNVFSLYDATKDASVSPFDNYVQQKDAYIYGDPAGCTSYPARTRYMNARNLLRMEDGISGADIFWIGFPGPLWDFPDLDVILEASPGVYSVRTFDATELWALTNKDARDRRRLKPSTATLPGITDTNDTMTITLRY